MLLLIFFKIPKPLAPLIDSYTFSKNIIAEDGTLLRLTLADDDRFRLRTTFKDIPDFYVEKILDKEDRYFLYHFGVNPAALVRSFTYKYILNKKTSGASTVTMQLARLHYKLRTKTISGKLKQIMWAIWLEFLYSKKEILEAYVNIVPFGRNIEGIKAASLIYFHKGLSKLNTNEVYFLVSTPQRPNLLNGINKFGPIPGTIIDSMSRLKSIKIDRNDLWIHPLNELPFIAPHVSWQAINTSESLKKDKQQSSEVKTTINLDIQKKLSHILRSYLKRNKDIGLRNGAALVLNYKTKEIKGLVGSKDYFDKSILGQVDGTIAKRSPGSTLKPLAYAMALEAGLIHPNSMMMDVPLPFRMPENFDRQFKGPMSAIDALVTSRNIPAVWLASKLKKPSIFDLLKKMNVKKMRKSHHYGTSIILGGIELSMRELVSIYSMLANGGVYSDIKLLENEAIRGGIKVLSKEASVMALNMLKTNGRPEYDKRFTLNSDQNVYWKTGTSFGFRDAWSIGITGHYVIAVWLGNFSGEPNSSLIGRKAAGPLFFEIVDGLKSNSKYSYSEFLSENVKQVKICKTSGKIPNSHCKHIIEGDFWPGVSPIDKCKIHRKLLIAIDTGLRACSKTKGNKEYRLFEVWPSHLTSLFKNIGQPRARLPKWGIECLISDKNERGFEPVILSPKRGMTYHKRFGGEHNTIALKAQVDSNAEEVFWYINGSFLGKGRPSETFFWKSVAGNHKVKLVDDLGRVATRRLKVILTK
jgi:penicillin-binding protein 1C